jgi:iron complex outermembrane receptor protein
MVRERGPSLAGRAGRTAALSLAAWASLAAAAQGADADAQDKRVFNIKRGALAEALKAFSQQANMSVMTFADVSDKTGRGVSGVLPPESALAMLISGQGLRAQYVGGGYVLKNAAALPPPVARPAPPPAATSPTQVDSVVVTTYRDSLLHAHDIQRAAVGSEAVILADDIAAFPDLNLAESLQRIPGVSITRDAGEGRQITLRGLGPDFTRTQLNGMEVLANTASGMDNRGSVSRTRAFDFSMFASELFDKVTVQKSYAAEQDEGGIAGTVQLQTGKPFDYDGFKGVISAKGQNNSNTGTTTPHVVGLVSNRWGDFGALASVAYSENDSNEYGYRNWGWSQIHVNPANIGPGVSPDVAARLEANGPGEVYAPQAETYSTWFTHRKRLGATVALQYDPGQRLKMGLDLLYGRLTNDRNDYALAAAGTNGLTGAVTGTQVLNSAVIQGDSLVAASYSGVDQRSEFNQMNDSTDFYQAVFNATYQASDRLQIKGLLGYSESDYRLPVFDKVFMESQNHDFSFDDRPAMPVNTYGFNITDPNQWSLMRLDTQENGIISQYANAKLDLAYTVSPASTLKVGAEYKDFTNAGWQRDDKVFHNVPTDTPIPNADKLTVPYAGIAPYAVGDVGATYAFIGQIRRLDPSFTMPGTDYQVREKTAAAYVQYDLNTDVLGYPVKANAGLRYYATDLTSSGSLNTGAALVPVTISHRYDGVLPALNIAVDVARDVVARFSANRNISRPALSDLAAAGTLTTAPFGGTVSAGNPNLTPFLADSVEGSVEYYLGRVGYLSVGLFYKNMKSFITTETAVVPYGSTGFPVSFLLPGQDGSILYNFNRPINGPGASIRGLEAGFQRDFDFLPAPLDRAGLTANVTYADGSSPVLYSGVPVVLPLTNLSRYSANATLYYETARWGARMSEAYRDKYLDSAGGSGNIGEMIGATSNVDFQAHYNLDRRLKLIVEGINLTDQHIVQYTDVTAKRIEVNTSSGRTFTFGFSYEF